MIKEVRLVNYRKFLRETIHLEPITLFVGPNGSGKSTLASALYTIATILRMGLDSAFPEGFYAFNNLIHFEAEKLGYRFAPIGLGISGSINKFDFDYDIVFGRDSNSLSGYFIHYEGIRIKDEEFSCAYSTGEHPRELKDLPTRTEENLWIPDVSHHPQRDCLFSQMDEAEMDAVVGGYLKEIRRYMQRMTKYQFSPTATRMGYEQYDSIGRQPFLKSDGANLAEVVQFFQEEQRGLFAHLKERIIEYARGECNLVDIGVTTYEDKAYLIFYEEGKGKKTFPVRGPLLSDGYWVFAAFACLASCEILPSIAFFEEPESFLHPHKLKTLYQVFEQMGKRETAPCQILISTHSPYFLSAFKDNPDSVVVVNDGRTRKLNETEGYEDVVSRYSLEEDWFSNLCKKEEEDG